MLSSAILCNSIYLFIRNIITYKVTWFKPGKVCKKFCFEEMSFKAGGGTLQTCKTTTIPSSIAPKMSERKAINKYYPPDYDPVKAEKAARSISKKLKSSGRTESSIRLMTPFSMRCLKCDEYIPKSRKFNGKKSVLEEKYLGSIRMYRFSIRCPQCANTITFRTDPKSSDYVMEVGGVRNYVQVQKQPEQETLQQTLERLAREKEEESKGVDQGKGKVEVLEERLAKLQKQQRDAEELDKLIQRKQLEADVDVISEEKKLDDAVDIAFAAEHTRRTASPAVKNSPAPAPAPAPTAPSLPRKITLKSKKKSLGIVKRRAP